MQRRRYDRGPEEAHRRAGRHSTREDPHPKVVHSLQGETGGAGTEIRDRDIDVSQAKRTGIAGV